MSVCGAWSVPAAASRASCRTLSVGASGAACPARRVVQKCAPPPPRPQRPHRPPGGSSTRSSEDGCQRGQRREQTRVHSPRPQKLHSGAACALRVGSLSFVVEDERAYSVLRELKIVDHVCACRHVSRSRNARERAPRVRATRVLRQPARISYLASVKGCGALLRVVSATRAAIPQRAGKQPEAREALCVSSAPPPSTLRPCTP